jgi:hypothetical protein
MHDRLEIQPGYVKRQIGERITTEVIKRPADNCIEANIVVKAGKRRPDVGPRTMRLWCPVHVQPFGLSGLRPSEPVTMDHLRAYANASKLLMDAVQESPVYLAAVARHLSGLELPVDMEPLAEHVEAVLDDRSACCTLEPKQLLGIYHDAIRVMAPGEKPFGPLSVCSKCLIRRRGSPLATPSSRWKHICFNCLTHSLAVGRRPRGN